MVRSSSAHPIWRFVVGCSPLSNVQVLHAMMPQSLQEWPERQIRILIVDDGPMNRKLLRIHLENWGPFVIDDAVNGQHAVEKVRAAETPYDAILMDINMPVLDGYGATQTIRFLENSKGLPATPIYGITANVIASEDSHWHTCGMTAMFTKPVDWTGLRQALRRALWASTTGSPSPSTHSPCSRGSGFQFHLDMEQDFASPSTAPEASGLLNPSQAWGRM